MNRSQVKPISELLNNTKKTRELKEKLVFTEYVHDGQERVVAIWQPDNFEAVYSITPFLYLAVNLKNCGPGRESTWVYVGKWVDEEVR